jgi:cytochrome c oxidase subunit 2
MTNFFIISSIVIVGSHFFNLSYTTDYFNQDYASHRYPIDFQEPASIMMTGIVDLHHYVFTFLVAVLAFVVWLFFRILYLFHEKRNQVTFSIPNATVTEIVWTVVPMAILVAIAIPSFTLLYTQDELINPEITLKVIGHQWYWSYEYSDYASDELDDRGFLSFDSFMLPDANLTPEQPFRLLEVDEPVVLPINTHVRIIVTAADVLHSWAVPALGVKMDAVPGRLNQTSVFITEPGRYFGQCSEICGENHGFMPIVVKAVGLNNYLDWLSDYDE